MKISLIECLLHFSSNYFLCLIVNVTIPIFRLKIVMWTFSIMYQIEHSIGIHTGGIGVLGYWQVASLAHCLILFPNIPR